MVRCVSALPFAARYRFIIPVGALRRNGPTANTSLVSRQESMHHWAHPVRFCGNCFQQVIISFIPAPLGIVSSYHISCFALRMEFNSMKKGNRQLRFPFIFYPPYL
jgi:hypothetical protein